MRQSERKGPYRSRDGMVLGVIKGFAEYFDFSTFWLRFFALILILGSGGIGGLILYFLVALIMKREPLPGENGYDEAGSNTTAGEMDRLKSRFERLDERIQKMENVVTSRDYEWSNKLNKKS